MAKQEQNSPGASPLWDLDRALSYLRLDKRERKRALRTLKYYRDKRLLKATRIGKHLFYTQKALDEFIEAQTGAG